jgi:elongation factor Ts
MADMELIKKLREETSARISDCLAASKETSSYADAVDWLRKKNILISGHQGIPADEGLLGHYFDDNAFTVIELSANTDFATKNREFTELMEELLVVASINKVSTVDQLLSITEGHPAESIKEISGKLGENIVVKNLWRLEEKGCVFGYYFHHDRRQGAVVALEAPSEEGPSEMETREVGKDLAMHVVFAKPKYMSREHVPLGLVNREKAFIKERLLDDPKNSKKPPEILEKITIGQLNKFYAQDCLTDQSYYRPDVKKSVSEFMKSEHPGVVVNYFHHFQVG